MISIPFPGKYKLGLMLLGDIFTSLHFAVQPEGLGTCAKHRKSVQKYKIKSSADKGVFQLSIFLEYSEEVHKRTLRSGCLGDTFN